MSQRKFIIDCDTGVDDAYAIMLALSRKDVDVVAITCVNGNTALDQVAVNVMKVLEVCQRSDVPVYKGAPKPLIRKYQKTFSIDREVNHAILFKSVTLKTEVPFVILSPLYFECLYRITIAVIGPAQDKIG